MVRRLIVALCGLALVSAGCGSGDPRDEPGLRVSVTQGAPHQLQGAGGEVGQYVPASDSVVYVSGFQYSSTCVPTGKATQTGSVITLSIDAPEGNCTADAERDTFRIEHLATAPDRLRVVEDGQPDLELHLTP